MNEALAGAVSLFAAGVLCASVAWSSYVFARRLDPDARASQRLAATIGLAMWQLSAAFWLLIAVGGFGLLAGISLRAAAYKTASST